MSAATLSPAVIRVGGAMEKVFEKSEDYVGYPVSKRLQTAIARLVEARPELSLNSEDSIVKILDLATFHGISQMARLGQQIDEYGVETVHLAVDYLYESAERGRAGDKTDLVFNGFGIPRRYMTGLDSVDKVAELIGNLTAVTGTAFSGVERLDDVISELGGLKKALNLSTLEMAQALELEFVLDHVNNDEEEYEPGDNG